MTFYLKGLAVRFNPFFLAILFGSLFLGIIKEALIIFGAILIHEGAHIAAGKVRGYKISEIELMPFGGVAKIEGLIGAHPSDEVIISLSGPLLNILLGCIAMICSLKGIPVGDLFLFFIKVNFSLALFNLLPALPLDGGRIMRAYLSIFMGYKKATDIAIMCGRILAALLLLLGIYVVIGGSYNLMPLIMSIFIFVTLKREQGFVAYVFLKNISKKKEKIINSGVIKRGGLIVLDETLIKDVIWSFTPDKYFTITVVNKEWKIIGEFTESEIINGIIRKGIKARIKDIMD